MNSEIVDISGTIKELRVEIAPDEVRRVYDSVSRAYANKAQVPGFRKGMAPLDVVRMRFMEDIKNDVIKELLPDQVTLAIQQHELQPITEPQLFMDDPENVKVNGSQPLTVRIQVEVMPEIPDPEYKGIEATKRVKPVSDEEIDSVIDERRQQNSTMVPVEDRKSAEGDVVIVDLKGTFLDDENADPIEVQDLEVNLGDGLVEQSFTENLIGVEQDEEREFTVEYPEEFSSTALAGRKVSYVAKVKSVGVVELPEADDDWVVSLDEGFESLKDLKENLRNDLESLSKADADGRVRNDLIAKLIEKHDFEIPEALISSQAKTLLDNFAHDLSQRGVDLTKVEDSFIETAYMQMRTQAERDVRGAMLLEKIAEVENVEVSEEEIKNEIAQMAGYYQVSEEEIKKQIDTQGGDAMVSNNLRTRKAVEALVAHATITESEWHDGESEEESEEATDQGKAESVKQEKLKADKSNAKKPKAKPAKKKEKSV